MTEGTVYDLGWPGMIAQFTQGEHFSAINRLAGGGVTLGTERGLGFWINTVADQHLGIGSHHGVGGAGQTLLFYAGEHCLFKISGHEHVHDHRWNDFAAWVQRHD